jgi:hypothetical protein
MEWHNMLDAQTFSDIDIKMNGDIAVNVYVFNGEWTKLTRFKFGRIMMNNKTFVSRLVIMMTMIAVGSS